MKPMVLQCSQCPNLVQRKRKGKAVCFECKQKRIKAYVELYKAKLKVKNRYFPEKLKTAVDNSPY